MSIKKVISPVRIDFAGGTTDISPFKDKYGGCVLNATINRYVVGKLVKDDNTTHLEYTGNIPTSSGLGTSGVMNLVWLTLISQSKDIKDKTQLAEEVYKIEQSIGLVGGKQDQYASAFGGINFMEFSKDKVKVTPLKLSKQFIKKLEDNLVLVYTGKPHFSGNTNKAAMDNLIKGKNDENLLRLKKIAIEMKNALLKEDLDKFANLLNEETKERKQLDKSIVPKEIQTIIDQAMQNGGAIAAKVCGSGGGGSILFLGNKKQLKAKFKNKIIDFKFDFDGLRIL